MCFSFPPFLRSYRKAMRANPPRRKSDSGGNFENFNSTQQTSNATNVTFSKSPVSQPCVEEEQALATATPTGSHNIYRF